MWTPEEEEALRQGVQKHGIGSWEIIRQDTSFSNLLWWAIGRLCRPTASLRRVHGRLGAHNYGPLGFFDVHQNFSHDALWRGVRPKLTLEKSSRIMILYIDAQLLAGLVAW